MTDRFTVEYDAAGAFNGERWIYKVYDIEADDWDRPIASFLTIWEAREYIEERLSSGNVTGTEQAHERGREWDTR